MNKAQFFESINYKPHKVQWMFHNSPARFRVPVCGRRTGKSTMAMRDRLPMLFKPKTIGWIVGPTYDLGEKEFRIAWNDLIIGKKLGLDKRVKRAYSKKQGNMYIEMPWGARVEVRSSDHPETLVGEGLDWLIVSEAAKQSVEVWEKYLRPALSDKRGPADFPTTPEGQNWLYTLWQQGQNPSFEDWESWQFPSWVNSVVFPGGVNDPEILAVKRTTTKEWFDQEYGAEFTSFVGRIFDAWSEVTHVKAHTFNPLWDNYIAFDPGFTNPFSAIEFQVSPWDTIHVWREYYQAGLTLEQHLANLQDRENPEGYHLDCGFSDAADPEAALYISHHFVNTLVDPEAKKNWRQGVDLIETFMQEVETGNILDEYGTPEMAPRFFVDYSCKQLIYEINNYRRKPPPRTIYPSDPQDAPIKKDDHGIDAIRYALVHLYELGAQHHLEDVAPYNPTVSSSNTLTHSIIVPQQRAYPEPPSATPMDELYELLGVPAATVGDELTVFNFGSKEPIF